MVRFLRRWLVAMIVGLTVVVAVLAGAALCVWTTLYAFHNFDAEQWAWLVVGAFLFVTALAAVEPKDKEASNG